MFINPKTAIKNGWITGVELDSKNVQPNAIDFTLDKLYTIDHQKTFIISEENKMMRGGNKKETHPGEDYWCISQQTVYDGMSDMYLDLPEGVAAQLIVRSTFNRNGVFIMSGLYDSGYQGNIGFAIYNMSGPAQIVPGTRIGQVIFVQSDSAGVYAGGYNHEEGTHWSDINDKITEQEES